MHYPYLELSGYTRIAASGHTNITLRFTSPVQQILGDNGSGKSSLLEQLSPLPPNPEDFTKPGHKIIHLVHDGQLYILGNVFSRDPKHVVTHNEMRFEVGHTFYMNGEDLNPGGTQTVQRDLCREHFGITPEKHALLLGVDPRQKFTSMNAAKRKEWVLALCDTDYEYALKAYNKLKERHRDVQGAIKQAKKRLMMESEKLLESEEEKLLREETQALHQALNALLEMRKPLDTSVEQLQQSQSDKDRQLMQLAQEIDKVSDYPFSYRQLEAYPMALEELGRTHAQEQGLLNHFTQLGSQQSEKIEVLKRAEAQSIETLRRDIDHLISQVHATQLLVFQFEEAAEAHTVFQAVKPTLMDVFLEIKPNPERVYSGNALAAAREELAALHLKRSTIVERLADSKAKLKHQEHHKSHPDLRCPKCSHDFSAHYDQAKHAMYQDLVNADEKTALPEVDQHIARVTEFMEACQEYGRTMRVYQQVQQNAPILKPYWDWLAQQDFLYKEPARGMHFIQEIENDLVRQLTVEGLMKEREKKESLLQALEKVGGDDLQALLQAHEQTLEKIEHHTTKAQRASYDHAHLGQEYRVFKDIKVKLDKLRALMTGKGELVVQEVEQLRRIHLNNAIRQLQSALAAREHRLNSLGEQQQVVKSAESHLSELERDEEALKLMVAELSPTEGIIAEGLMGFLKRFVNQMNALIAQVWSYSLVIQTCDFTSEDAVDLDYNFPFEAKGEWRSDVKKGSTGMKEIFDFAFIIIAKKYMHLSTHPIYLDEFSASMDVVHRQNSVMLIKMLMEQQAFSQIFMISHDFAQYSSLTHAQVCVMSPDNIVTPQTYNEHVVFG